MDSNTTNKYEKVERSLKALMIVLMVEFVLGVLLTTVINFNPNNQGIMQKSVLLLHVLVAIGLIVGSSVHIVVARRLHILGVKPIIGLLCILGAFVSGSISSQNGNSVAVLLMALFFAAAIAIYGRSYLAVKLTDNSK